MGLNKVSEAPQGQKDKGIKVSGLGGSEVQPVGLGFLALCIYRLGLMGAYAGLWGFGFRTPATRRSHARTSTE